MHGDVVHRLVGILVAQLIGQILVNGDPQLLALDAHVLGLLGAVVAVYDQGIDPGGRLAGEPAVVALPHGLARPAFKSVGAVRRGPGPQVHGFPGQGNIGVDHELLHVGRDLAPQLSIIGDGRGLILRNRDPDLLTGLHRDAVGLNRLVRALVRVHDDVLHEVGNVGVVPALCQSLHFLTGPGRKGVGPVVCPGPQIRSIPALRHLNDHGDHDLIRFRLTLRESRCGQHPKQHHNG